MEFTVFGYTIQISKKRNALLRKALKNLPFVSRPSNGESSRRIQMIISLRQVEPSLGLKEAKDLADSAFNFSTDPPTINS